MSRRLLSFLTVTVLIAMTLPAWARSNSADSLKATIDVSSTIHVSNKTLEPGEYTVVAEGSQAKFERNGNVIAEVPCTLKTLSNKSPYTAVLINKGRITEIDLSGKTQAIEFKSNQNARS